MKSLWNVFSIIKNEFYADEESVYVLTRYSFDSPERRNMELREIVQNINPSKSFDVEGWGGAFIKLPNPTKSLYIIKCDMDEYDMGLYDSLCFRSFYTELPDERGELVEKEVYTIAIPKDINKLSLEDIIVLIWNIYIHVLNFYVESIRTKLQASIAISLMYLAVYDLLNDGMKIDEIGKKFFIDNFNIVFLINNGFDCKSCFTEEEYNKVLDNMKNLDLDLDGITDLLYDMKDAEKLKLLCKYGIYRRMGAILYASIPEASDDDKEE